MISWRAIYVLGDRIRRLGRDRAGNVGMLFAFAVLPILGAAGLGIDYNRQIGYRAQLQQATDAAALATMLAVSKSDASQLQATAQKQFNSAFSQTGLAPVPVTASYDAAKPSVTISAVASVPTQIVKMFGYPVLTVGATSTATTAAGTGRTWPVCVLILASTEKHTLMTENSAQIQFSDCMVQVNTNDWDAVEARGASSINSTNGENCFVGDIHYGNVTPEKNPSCTFFADPFAGQPMPTAAATCTYQNFTTTAAEATLQPGTYCGNTNINGGNITLASGLYIIKDGNFTINGNSKVTANGVTFLLTGSGPNFYVAGNASLNLTPYSSGQFAGFAMYLDNNSVVTACAPYTDGGQMLKSPSMDSGFTTSTKTVKQVNQTGIANCVNAISGTSRVTMSGIVYLANAAFIATDSSVINLKGSFVSKYLLADNNATMSLVGALPSSSSIAASMQKISQNTQKSALRLIK